MSRFPSVGHLMSWTGCCLRLDESAGETALDADSADIPLARTNTDQRGVGRHSQEGLLPAPNSGGSKDAAARRSLLAVASSMLTAACFMLRDGVE